MPSKRQRGGAPTQRQLRASELVRHALVEILAREQLRDPDLAGISVTIGEVRASPDIKHMTVFVAPLGKGDAKIVAEALNRCAPFLRGRLGRHIELRNTPALHFIPDLSYDAAGHMAEVLNRPEVRRDLDRSSEGDE